MKTYQIRSRSGSVIAVALIISVLLGVLMVSLLGFGLSERRLNSQHKTWTDARYGAEAVLEYGLGDMFSRITRASSIPTNTMITTAPALVPASFFANSSVDPASLRIAGGNFSAASYVTIPQVPAVDPLRGRTVLVRTALIFASATAKNPTTGTASTSWCSSQIQLRYNPWLTGLGSYLPDLEIAPGPQMDCYGDFSTKGNLYLQSGSALNFWRRVVCGGKLYHGRKANGGVGESGGAVALADESGTLVSLYQNGAWVTSNTTDFAQLALALWDGNLLTGAMGATVPDLPAIGKYTPYNAADDTSNAPHKLIEKPIANTNTAKDSAGQAVYDPEVEVQKFANMAGLVITIAANGTAKAYKYTLDAGGTYTREDPDTGARQQYRRDEVTLPADTVQPFQMYDQRRGTTQLTMYNVDVSNLYDAINGTNAADQIGNFNKDHDWNGVVYVEMAAPGNSGVRVSNGSKIPNFGHQQGMSLATNAPLYVKGNYNADGSLPSTQKQMGVPETLEVPAALIGDAITVLSNNWKDTNSGKPNLSDRPATVTEVSAAFIAGAVPTNANSNGTYSGGFENFPRFLENWGGVKFGYRGGVVVLFDSEIATQPWPNTGRVYEAPNRLWAYNEMFMINPPKLMPAAPNPNHVSFTEYKSQAEFDAAIAAAQGL